jgi:hypothetical protein
MGAFILDFGMISSNVTPFQHLAHSTAAVMHQGLHFRTFGQNNGIEMCGTGCTSTRQTDRHTYRQTDRQQLQPSTQLAAFSFNENQSIVAYTVSSALNIGLYVTINGMLTRLSNRSHVSLPPQFIVANMHRSAGH